MANNPLDEKFNMRRQQIAEQGKSEYEEIYKRMIEKLQPSHLEPFFKILLENDDFHLNCAVSMDALKGTLLEELLKTWHEHIWDVAVDKLTHLELLKDQLEGRDVRSLNIKNKTAEERLLPLHMHYKEKRLVYLKKQIEHQSKIIESMAARAVKCRQTLRSIEEDCLVLNEAISNQRKQEELPNEKMLQEFTKLLRDEEDGVFEAKPKVKEEF